MSKITLENLSHSYLDKQNSDSDWALRNIDLDWKDGGAYALLGPSGPYELERLQPVDFFPQTTHLESLALLKRISS